MVATKVQTAEKMEFNAAFGGDYPFRSGVKGLSIEQQTTVSRNTTVSSTRFISLARICCFRWNIAGSGRPASTGQSGLPIM